MGDEVYGLMALKHALILRHRYCFEALAGHICPKGLEFVTCGLHCKNDSNSVNLTDIEALFGEVLIHKSYFRSCELLEY